MMALISNLPFSHLDDEEFALMLYELQNGPVHFDHDRLSNLLFNPLTSNLDRYLIRPEDAHVKTHSRYDFYFQDKFRDDNYFSIFHLNIRSLRNKLDGLTTLLANLDIRFSIVGITQTWLQESTHNVDIDGYDFVYKNRSFKSGRCVGLYVSNNLNDRVMETLFIEIIRPHGKILF